MLAYPKHGTYYDSGFDWLGNIPEDWQTIRAKYVLREIDERARTGDEELLSVSHLTGVTPRSEKNVNMFLAEDYTGAKLCQPNDVVVNTMWAWMGALGVSPMEGLVSPSYGVYRPNEKVFPKFLDSLLRTPQYIAEYIRRSTGIHSSRLRLYPNQFLDIPLLLPPLDKQKRIVEFIDHKTSEIDQASAQKQRLIELLQEQKTILINQAVTKGLDPSVPTCDSGIECIGKIPKHWKLKRVKNVSSFVTSGPRGWADYYADEGSFFLQSGNLNNSMGIELEKANKVQPPNGAEGRRTRLRNNDVLVCVTGANTGRVAIAKLGEEEVYINQHLCLIRPTKDIYPDFLSFCLHSAVGQTYFFLSQYGLKEGLGLEDVKNAVILEPPLGEQKEITKFLSEFIEELDRAEVKTLNQIARFSELKSTFIAEAVTGKIRV